MPEPELPPVPPPHAAYSARLACESKELKRGERFILEAALPFKSGCMWLTDADCGTFGRAPVDVCSDVDVAGAVTLVLLLLQPPALLLLGPTAGSRDVTVLLGAIIVPLLLRKCLKENVDVEVEEPTFELSVALVVAVAVTVAALAVAAAPVVARIFV